MPRKLKNQTFIARQAIADRAANSVAMSVALWQFQREIEKDPLEREKFEQKADKMTKQFLVELTIAFKPEVSIINTAIEHFENQIAFHMETERRRYAR